MTRMEAVVVGGGLAGLAAAIAVARAGFDTVHLAPPGPRDQRTSALMLPSVAWLQRAGLIGDPATLGHPLTRIRIIDATARLMRAPETLFDSAETDLSAFGWNFPNVLLMEAFEKARTGLANLETRSIGLRALERHGDGASLTLSDGSMLDASLVVGADGKKSLVRAAAGFRAREHGFSQSALVCDLELGRPLESTSVEFHYDRGPFTLVPAGGNRANLVWIDDRAALRSAQESGRENLREIFLAKSQRLFGDIQLATPAHLFPLSTISVEKAGADGVVLVGEAAHAFPPIGAQGLNLGLRDVADLSDALLSAKAKPAAWPRTVSEDYARRRAGDLARTGTMVDTLFRSLLTDMLPAQFLRAGGLWALKLLPPLRKRAFRVGMGAN
jgi:2-octaprenyl-6-methoxyphenol hydroxylase